MFKIFLDNPGLYFAVLECLKVKEFIEHFDRLHGCNLQQRGTILDIQIDKATGRLESDLVEFINFVYEYVYLPLKGGRK